MLKSVLQSKGGKFAGGVLRAIITSDQLRDAMASEYPLHGLDHGSGCGGSELDYLRVAGEVVHQQ